MGGGRGLGPLPHPARTLAHDPVQGTLAVCDGLFDSFGEQLGPGKYKWGYHQGPSKPPHTAQRPNAPGLSLCICAMGHLPLDSPGLGPLPHPQLSC